MTRILTELLHRIDQLAPPGAYVSLIADEPGRRLYERHGFVPTAPSSIGMAILRKGSIRRRSAVDVRRDAAVEQADPPRREPLP